MSDLVTRCKQVKLVLSDVDGVLTDAGMYYSEAGDELKKFCTLDGGGFMLLRNVGIRTGLLTSEETQLVERRGAKLQLDFVLQGVKDKFRRTAELLLELGLSPDQLAYIGDDINDLPLLKTAGVSATVPDNCLPPEFRCDYVTTRPGGRGAVRDFAEWLLRQRGEYARALDAYLENLNP